MAISIQTNVNSLVAQENLRLTGEFQSRTIQRLTSGYRINSSADDAAGLAVANKYRTDVAELMQGVRNANDGVSQLQIMDGGIGNITKMLDRMKTLATQSASSTFSGSRITLNQEFQNLVKEIDRQAANIGLNAGGAYNTKISVYTGGAGGANTQATVNMDLSGAAGQVDSIGLGLDTQNILAGGTAMAGTGTLGRWDTPGWRSAAPDPAAVPPTTGNQDITLFVYTSSGAQQVKVTVNKGDAAGQTANQVLDNLNGQLKGYGLNASVDNNGALQIGGGAAFSMEALAGDYAAATTNRTNASMYQTNGKTWAAAAEKLTISNGIGNVVVDFSGVPPAGPAPADIGSAIAAINQKTAPLGVYAVNSGGVGGVISFQSQGSFLVNTDTAGGTFTNAGAHNMDPAMDPETLVAPTSTGTDNGTAAINKIGQALAQVGSVQGTIGSGQNKLSYAIQLAQSQISSYSAAESRIRDADVAAEAANLTKAQVLSQASMAAMAQANSAPQQVLSLLRG